MQARRWLASALAFALPLGLQGCLTQHVWTSLTQPEEGVRTSVHRLESSDAYLATSSRHTPRRLALRVDTVDALARWSDNATTWLECEGARNSELTCVALAGELGLHPVSASLSLHTDPLAKGSRTLWGESTVVAELDSSAWGQVLARDSTPRELVEGRAALPDRRHWSHVEEHPWIFWITGVDQPRQYRLAGALGERGQVLEDPAELDALLEPSNHGSWHELEKYDLVVAATNLDSGAIVYLRIPAETGALCGNARIYGDGESLEVRIGSQWVVRPGRDSPPAGIRTEITWDEEWRTELVLHESLSGPNPLRYVAAVFVTPFTAAVDVASCGLVAAIFLSTNKKDRKKR